MNPSAAPTCECAFPRAWEAQILTERPLILPPHRFTYPREAEEVERGALEVLIRPTSAPPFLATFALGFADPSVPSGLWTCPDPRQLCALSGGYAYLIDTETPSRFAHLDLRPVLEVRPLPEHHLLLFAGSRSLIAWGREGQCWQSPALSSEGLRLAAIEGHHLHGFGWDLLSDREVPFTLDLRSGQASSIR